MLALLGYEDPANPKGNAGFLVFVEHQLHHIGEIRRYFMSANIGKVETTEDKTKAKDAQAGQPRQPQQAAPVKKEAHEEKRGFIDTVLHRKNS